MTQRFSFTCPRLDASRLGLSLLLLGGLFLVTTARAETPFASISLSTELSVSALSRPRASVAGVTVPIAMPPYPESALFSGSGGDIGDTQIFSASRVTTSSHVAPCTLYPDTIWNSKWVAKGSPLSTTRSEAHDGLGLDASTTNGSWRTDSGVVASSNINENGIFEGNAGFLLPSLPAR
jgi:hypothetical protein